MLSLTSRGSLIVYLLVLVYIYSSHQQEPSAVTTNNPTIRTRGFADIVQPVENVSNTQNDFQSISGRSQCNCVPYHLCDPTTGNVDAEEETFDGFGLIDLRFGENENNAPACPHFLDVCCEGEKVQNRSLTPVPQDERPYRPQGCGIRNVGGIDFNLTGANNNEAGFGEFPWTVALLLASNSSYFCTGSLIHPQVVLTAVHCINQPPNNNFIVRAGEWDTQTTKERLPFVERGVKQIILHPQFNHRNAAYDFALVVLEEPYTLCDHINVVCLPPQNVAPAAQTVCFSTGWGKLAFGAENRFSAIMKRVPLPIVERSTCQKQLRATRLGPRFALHRSFICAGGQRDVDTCKGDGGAPLVCPIGIPSDQRYEQSGIVAWGIGCNDEIPAAYADVSLVRNWIDEQMLANGFDTSSYSTNI